MPHARAKNLRFGNPCIGGGMENKMSYTKREYKVASSDGKHRLAGFVYLPEGEAKGFFHIAHGMTE